MNSCKNVFIYITEDDHKNIEGISFFNSSLVINGLGNFGEIFRYIDDDNFNQYIKFSKNTKKISISFHDGNNNNVELNSGYQLILKKM